MLNLFDFLRFKRQAPTNRPPKGYYDIRISKSTGALVLVDDDGTETPVGSSLASLAVTGNATVGGTLGVTGATTAGSLVLVSGSSEEGRATLSATLVTAARTQNLPDIAGTVAVVPTYDDESAANAAEAANVVYYSDSEGKFMVTTA